MALNKFMHPRNPYKDRKPDFKELAIKYEEFRKHATQDIKGGVHINFKKPECLRALSWALLKDTFGLDVEMPLDRLIPTVPLRVNYILWLEDLVKTEEEDKAISGIDIGCGASCVYPLLGAKKNGWKFLSSEVDSQNFQYAKRNVTRNLLDEQITVIEVKEDSGLLELLENREENFDFVMCNPPFFGSNLEAWATYSTRNDSRPEPMSVSTASPKESVIPGGEVNFVKRMIADSLMLKGRVRIYTAMLGKKSSLAPLKQELENHSIPNIGITEFSQGRTMRWGIGWSFDTTVNFPKPPTTLVKRTAKIKPPLVFVVPKTSEGDYTIASISLKIMAALDDFKITYEPEKSTDVCMVLLVVAQENTWLHQRRKRREAERIKESSVVTNEAHIDNDTPKIDSPPLKRRKLGGSETGDSNLADNETAGRDSAREHNVTQDKLDMTSKETKTSKSLDLSIEDIEEFVLKCTLTLRKDSDNIQIEMLWIDGQSKELLHQLLQVLKNRLK